MAKKLDFWQKIYFWPKFQFFDQNLNFLTKFQFLTKISFFWPKFRFLTKFFWFSSANSKTCRIIPFGFKPFPGWFSNNLKLVSVIFFCSGGVSNLVRIRKSLFGNRWRIITRPRVLPRLLSNSGNSLFKTKKVWQKMAKMWFKSYYFCGQNFATTNNYFVIFLWKYKYKNIGMTNTNSRKICYFLKFC